MDSKSSRVSSHFENMANIFDTIYQGEQKSLLYKIVDILFRKYILESRLKIILDFAGDVKDKEILDIGCGSGRYDILLAKGCPKSILGLDMSSLMIDMAEKLVKINNVSDICKFEKIEFIQKQFDNKFDIVIAAGVFDYVSDPKTFLLKIKSILKEKAIFSFPVKWSIFTLLRMIWLHKKDCPSYYYSKNDIKKLVKACGLKINSIRKIGSFLIPGNYIVVCGF